MNSPPDPPSTTPQLDDVPRGLRLMMRASVVIAGAGTAVVSFVLLMVILGVLNRIGVDGAIANMLMFLGAPGVIVAGVGAAMRMERLQERRLQASLMPPALAASTLSGTGTSAAIPATGTFVAVDRVDSVET
jgi:hypothetical protein